MRKTTVQTASTVIFDRIEKMSEPMIGLRVGLAALRWFRACPEVATGLRKPRCPLARNDSRATVRVDDLGTALVHYYKCDAADKREHPDNG